MAGPEEARGVGLKRSEGRFRPVSGFGVRVSGFGGGGEDSEALDFF